MLCLEKNTYFVHYALYPPQHPILQNLFPIFAANWNCKVKFPLLASFYGFVSSEYRSAQVFASHQDHCVWHRVQVHARAIVQIKQNIDCTNG